MCTGYCGERTILCYFYHLLLYSLHLETPTIFDSACWSSGISLFKHLILCEKDNTTHLRVYKNPQSLLKISLLVYRHEIQYLTCERIPRIMRIITLDLWQYILANVNKLGCTYFPGNLLNNLQFYTPECTITGIITHNDIFKFTDLSYSSCPLCMVKIIMANGWVWPIKSVCMHGVLHVC